MLVTVVMVSGSTATMVVLLPPTTALPIFKVETFPISDSDRTSSVNVGLTPTAKFVDCTEKSPGNVSVTDDDIEDLIEAPNTATKTTSATPIINADAVDAVRRGWRRVLS